MHVAVSIPNGILSRAQEVREAYQNQGKLPEVKGDVLKKGKHHHREAVRLTKQENVASMPWGIATLQEFQGQARSLQVKGSSES